MYVLIERKGMRVFHKHPDHAVITALAHIEVAHHATSVARIDVVTMFPGLTDYELILLYQQSTGHKFQGFSDFHLRELVLSMLRALPVSDVVPSEVFAQAATIADKDKGFYRYVKGSKLPAAPNDLFEPLPLTGDHTVAVHGIPDARMEPPAPDPDAIALVVRAAQQTAPRGGARGVIFEVADALWTAAGSPRELSVVLALRKTIMGVLETEHGVKRTTSSTALGDWQKQRIV